MSAFFQNPDPITEFEQLTADVRRVSPWQTMFDAAEEQLRADRPDGFNVEDIGRTAWNALPEAERVPAMDQLFYTYWSARENDAQELARYERERDMRILLRARLGEYQALTRLKAPIARTLVDDIADLAAELLGGAR